MAGFRKDQTGVAQTAANTAATLVAAALGAGVIGDIELAKKEFDSIRAATFEDLKTVVDADNELFAKVEAEQPAKSSYKGGNSSGGSKSGGGGGPIDVEEARGKELSFGKFKGCTLGELEAMTADEAEKYKPNNGPGLKYLEWLSKNENNAYMAVRAKAILDSRKATSAEAA